MQLSALVGGMTFDLLYDLLDLNNYCVGFFELFHVGIEFADEGKVGATMLHYRITKVLKFQMGLKFSPLERNTPKGRVMIGYV